MMPAASQTAISIFDNGTTVFENGVPEAVEESRGIALELDEQKMSAALVGEYTHPDKQYADAAGNVPGAAQRQRVCGMGWSTGHL